MTMTATVNVRLPDDLKRHGDPVLALHGVSVSDAIRALYEYLERQQRLPAFMTEIAGESLYDRRCRLAHSLVGTVSLPEGFNACEAHKFRLEER